MDIIKFDNQLYEIDVENSDKKFYKTFPISNIDTRNLITINLKFLKKYCVRSDEEGVKFNFIPDNNDPIVSNYFKFDQIIENIENTSCYIDEKKETVKKEITENLTSSKKEIVSNDTCLYKKKYEYKKNGENVYIDIPKGKKLTVKRTDGVSLFWVNKQTKKHSAIKLTKFEKMLADGTAKIYKK